MVPALSSPGCVGLVGTFQSEDRRTVNKRPPDTQSNGNNLVQNAAP